MFHLTVHLCIIHNIGHGTLISWRYILLKKFKSKLTLILLLIICSCLFWHIYKTKELQLTNISGKILLTDPLSYKENHIDRGLVLLDPVTTEMYPIGVEAVPAYFVNPSQVLLANFVDTVELFDIHTKESKVVYQLNKDKVGTQCGEIGCIDKTHFSMVVNNKLILVDIDNNVEKILAEDVGNDKHSWDKNNMTVYYSSTSNGKCDQICSINIESMHKEYLFEGYSPKISNDGNLIAYLTEVGNGKKLIIKELHGDKQWEYNAPIWDFCFDPSGKYIASVEWWRGIGYFQGYMLKIVDYKTNKTKIIVEKYSNGRCFSIDWK